MKQSLWLETAYPFVEHPKFEESISCDILIVGGGLSGLANAYFLAKEGKDVILLEKNTILHGATGNSTGKLTAQHDLVYADLIEQFGVDKAKIYFEANEEAIQFAKSVAAGDELKPAKSILYSQTAEGTDLLLKEKEAYDKIGIPHEFGGKATNLPFETSSTLTIPNEAQIHPARFGQHLARLAQEAGARLFEHAQVEAIDVDRRFAKLSSSVEVQFNRLILCTHYPIEAIEGMQILKLSVERSYIVAAKTKHPFEEQYISVDNPKRSIRTATIDGEHYLMLAGQSHQAGMKQDTQVYYQKLTEDMQKTLQHPDVAYQWSAQDPSTPDLVPYAGPISESLGHVFISTGYRKWGLSSSLTCAKIITDTIVERENKAAELYSPNRSDFGSLLAQGIKLAGYTLREFTGGHIARTDSPICTHMGCRTRWNKADSTWDCPCHGSRFREDGSVLEGPATKPLDLS